MTRLAYSLLAILTMSHMAHAASDSAVPLASPPAAPGAPAAKLPQMFFADDFSAPELGNAWDIVNRDPDAYTIEHNSLLIVARSAGGLGSEKIPNIFRLNRLLPDTDLTVTVKFNIAIQTLREYLAFGLFDNPKDYLVAELYSRSACCGNSDLVLRITKVGGGQTNQFEVPVTDSKTAKQPITMRLQRMAHSYRAGINFAGQTDSAGKPIWTETGTLTSLRPPKTFALNASQWEQNPGESPCHILAVTIEAAPR